MYKRVWGPVLSLVVLAVTASPLLAQDSDWPNWETGLFLHAKVGRGPGGLYLIEAMGFKPPTTNAFERVAEVGALKVDPASLPVTTQYSPIRLEPNSVQVIWSAKGTTVQALQRLFPAAIFQSRGAIHDPIPVWDSQTQKWIPRPPSYYDSALPPPFIPWWLAPFSYEPHHMRYLPTGSAILKKELGAAQYRIVSRPGETARSLPTFIAFMKKGDRYTLRTLWDRPGPMSAPEMVLLSKVRIEKDYVYEAAGSRSGRRLPTAIAVIKHDLQPGRPPAYQFAIRGGNMRITNPPLTTQRPSDPQPNWRRGAQDVVRGTVAREVGGLAQFAAAYLVKEGVKAALAGDAEVMKQAVRQMGTGSFWASLGVFTVASGATDFALRALPLNGTAQAIGRAALPLAAGMAAIQVLRGEASVKSVAISTGAYLGAGLAVGAAADAFLYPLLFRATPAGWVTAAWRIGTLAATLYAGEKFEEYLNSLFNRRTQLNGTPSPTSHRGVADQVEQLVND